MVRRRSGGATPSHEEEDRRPAASSHGGRDKKKYKGEGSERDANLDAAGVDAPRERWAQSQEHDSCVPGASFFYLLKTDHLLFFLNKYGVLCTVSTIESNNRSLRSLVGLGL
jgi:hypothetical protein